MLNLVLVLTVFALAPSEQSNTENEAFKDEILRKMQLMAEQHNEEIKQIKQKMTEQQKQLQQHIQESSSYVTSTQNASFEIEGRVTLLEEDMVVVQDGLQETENLLHEEIEAVEGIITGLQETDDIVHEEIEEIKENVTGLQETDDIVHEEIGGIKGNVTGLRRTDYLLNEEIEDIKETITDAEAVGFYAVVSTPTSLHLGSILTFDKIITNYGNAYSGISGTFTAPVHGLYQFTLHFITASPFPHTYLAILLNDIIKCQAFAVSGSNETGTCSTLLELMPGDLINVKLFFECAGNGGTVDGGYAGFMGHLYEPL